MTEVWSRRARDCCGVLGCDWPTRSFGTKGSTWAEWALCYRGTRIRTWVHHCESLRAHFLVQRSDLWSEPFTESDHIGILRICILAWNTSYKAVEGRLCHQTNQQKWQNFISLHTVRQKNSGDLFSCSHSFWLRVGCLLSMIFYFIIV